MAACPARSVIARVTIDAIERGLETVLAQEPEIGEELLDGHAPGGADVEREQARLIERVDGLTTSQTRRHGRIITGQHARPTQRIHARRQGRRQQLGKTADISDTRSLRQRRGRIHRG